MKIALLMAGYLRTIQNNLHSIKDNLIQDEKIDIYIHITKDEKNEDKYSNKITSLDYIKEKLNPKLIIVEDNLKENNLYNQFYKFYKLNEIRKLENITYDLIVKIRPDTYFHHPIDYKNIKENIVYLPEDSKADKDKIKNNNELCDIIAYGKEKIMNQYLNIYKHLYKIITDKINKPETILYNYLTTFNINYKKIKIEYSVILSLCKSIAITGDSGSGKTTLSKEISKLFKDSFILECDRYHKWERENDNWKKITHLNPEANYLAKMEKDVFDLKIGKDIYQINYDHNNGNFTNKELIESSPHMIICGLHAMYGTLKHNLNIFMDTEEELKIKWKVERDIKKRGYTIEKIMKQINERKEDYIKYILPQKEKADIIVNYKLLKDKVVMNLGIKNNKEFVWHYYDKGNYSQIILDFIKKLN